MLIERESKKSELEWSGRTSQNTVVVFPKEHYTVGDFVDVKINECTSATLIGSPVGISETHIKNGIRSSYKAAVWDHWNESLCLTERLEKALRVAVTDISVLVTGESGVGKENIPKIIHQYSHQKTCQIYRCKLWSNSRRNY